MNPITAAGWRAMGLAVVLGLALGTAGTLLYQKHAHTCPCAGGHVVQFVVGLAE